jgi:hypothetical protein
LKVVLSEEREREKKEGERKRERWERKKGIVCKEGVLQYLQWLVLRNSNKILFICNPLSLSLSLSFSLFSKPGRIFAGLQDNGEDREKLHKTERLQQNRPKNQRAEGLNAYRRSFKRYLGAKTSKDVMARSMCNVFI